MIADVFVKIVNPARKKDCVVRDLHKFRGKFNSLIELKVRLMEEFQELVPSTHHFSIGYFEGCQSTKKGGW